MLTIDLQECNLLLTHREGNKNMSRPVLVTTEHRGVFFGYADDIATAPTSIELSKMRNCIQWRGLKGFLELTTEGPSSACRIGPAATKGTLFKITGIWDVEPKAVEAWEKAPWNK